MNRLSFKISVSNNNREFPDYWLYAFATSSRPRLRPLRSLVPAASEREVALPHCTTDHLHLLVQAMLCAHRHYALHSLMKLWSMDYAYHLATIEFIRRLFTAYTKRARAKSSHLCAAALGEYAHSGDDYDRLHDRFRAYVFSEHGGDLSIDEKEWAVSCFPSKMQGMVDVFESRLIDAADVRRIERRPSFVRTLARRRAMELRAIERVVRARHRDGPTRTTTIIRLFSTRSHARP